MICVTSDWHLGNGSPADDSCEDGIRWVVDNALAYRPDILVVAGDMLEGWQFSWRDILKAKEELLGWIDHRLADSHVSLCVIRGNHDGKPITEALRTLRLVMPHCDLMGFEGEDSIEGYFLSHGQQWDPWNNPASPLYPVAHGLTAFASLLEYIGIDEQKVNPRNWFRGVTRKSHIADAALKSALKRNVYICHGHDHDLDYLAGGRVISCGCCVEGKGQFVALWPDHRPPIRHSMN